MEKTQTLGPEGPNNRMPAEFEKHSGTWLSFPYDINTWDEDSLHLLQETFMSIVDVIAEKELVHILVPDIETVNLDLDNYLNDLPDVSNIQLHTITNKDIWIRDYGPTFIHTQGIPLAMVNWIFNAWGNKYQDLIEDAYTSEKIEKILKIPRLCARMICEGGAIDVNGKGVCLTTDALLKRNPRLETRHIESYLRQYLGIDIIIWLQNENLPNDDTDGHIDNIARFVGERTILHSCEKGSENYKRLQKAKDGYGRDFWLVKMPKPNFAEDKELPASYLNFYICNSAVLVPMFGEPNDDIARDILSKQFEGTGRRIISVRSIELAEGFGGIHCITQQQPMPLRIEPEREMRVRQKPKGKRIGNITRLTNW